MEHKRTNNEGQKVRAESVAWTMAEGYFSSPAQNGYAAQQVRICRRRIGVFRLVASER